MPVETRRLTVDEARAALDDLSEVLYDCVQGGASVSFLAPFTRDDARDFFASVLPDVERGRRVLLAAYDGGELVGTVQLIHAWPPNQPHRADVSKLLVHRRARGKGAARALMERLEEEARADGKSLLVLDTVTDSPAFHLYANMGWTIVGPIPDFALFPDGRPCETTFFWKRV
ncbi:MAG TPA: GNAT family N-acetyltransferase [Gaiellaceae bacterium]